MKKILMITTALVLCMVLVLAAGCTQPATPPATTPTPAPTETTAAATSTVSSTPVSLTPGPTQTLPENWNVEVQVRTDGQAWDPHIIVSCQGGKGLNFVQKIDVTVTGSDGVVVTGVLNKPLYKGQSVTLRSTNAPGDKTDRVEIWATTPQGDKVKIYDAYVPFRTY